MPGPKCPWEQSSVLVGGSWRINSLVKFMDISLFQNLCLGHALDTSGCFSDDCFLLTLESHTRRGWLCWIVCIFSNVAVDTSGPQG